MQAKLYDTIVFDGQVELGEAAKEIEKQTGYKLMLEKTGETIHGYMNGYYKEIDGRQKTLIDIFLYSSDIDIKADKEKHTKRHQIKSIKEKEEKEKIKEALKGKFKLEKDIGVKSALLYRLGN
jgi:hypothetical protein